MPASASGCGSAGSFVVRPSRFASGSIVVPWRIVDSTTAKKTMLKNSSDSSGTPSITGKVARTTGTAPRRPAQPSSICSRWLKPNGSVDTSTAIGRATNTTTSASTVPSTATSPSWSGKTSRPSVRNMTSCATQPSPSWNAATVCLAGTFALPSSEAR